MSHDKSKSHHHDKSKSKELKLDCLEPELVQWRDGRDGQPGRAGKDGQPGRPGKDGTHGRPGRDGKDGRDGRDGPSGIPGQDGQDGFDGERGPRGHRGEPGCHGDRGFTGPTGPFGGPPGPPGPPGPEGTTGPLGGPPGPTGSAGQAGPTGSAGGLSNYGQIYNISSQNVPVENDITFDTNGIMTSIFIHVPGTSGLTVLADGMFQIFFNVLTLGPNQFAITVNGLPNAGTVFAVGSGMSQNNGQTILALSAGDVLTLRNHSSTTTATLPNMLAGSQLNVNASLLITKIA
jgi:hypothetical protein